MPVDLVIHSGALFIDGGVHPTADSIAVKDGSVVGVGTEADLHRQFGRAREVFDAKGGLVTPGFLDSHAHPLQGGYERLGCDLTDSTSAEDAVAIVAAYAAAHPDLDWIRGGGWHMQHFAAGRPRAEVLEQAVPGRKIFLVNADHHGAWVSPAGLDAVGITSTTHDPLGGIIDRDSDGTPSGTLQESAMDLVLSSLPEVTRDDYVDALVEAQRYFLSLGVTGWQDAIIGEYAGVGDSTEAYLTAFDRGLLNLTVTGALWLRRDVTMDTVDDAVASLVAQRARIGDRQSPSPKKARLRATSIKIMVDGVPESQTAALKQPYLDGHGHPTDNRGPSHFAPELLNAILPKLALEGFQLHFHAIGDRAVSEALDAVAAARAAGDDGHMNHHMAHLQAMDLADIPRMKQLGLIANLQALWAANSEQMLDLNRPIFGDERYSKQYPFKSIEDAGIPLAMGSDWPVSTPDPWQAIHVAVNRREPGDTVSEPLNLSEALSLSTCLTAYTAGSARVANQPDLGEIAVGMTADLAVASKNPFQCSPSELFTTATRATFVAGKQVNER